MPAPSAALATQRPDIAVSFEQFDLEMSWAGFVAMDILTVIDVPTQAGNFGIIPINQLLQTSATQRAPGGGYPRRNYTFLPGTYATIENGLEEPVDDREANMYRNYFSAEVIAAKRARDAVKRNYEIRVVNLVTNTGTFTNTPVATSWKTIASSDPVTDITTAIIAMKNASGMVPNTVVMSFTDFLNCRRSANLIQQIKYSGFDDPKLPLDTLKQILAEAFAVEKVKIAGAGEVKNTAAEDQTVSLSNIWPVGTIGVYVVDDSEDFKAPCVGRTFHWGEDGSSMGAVVESYRDETVRSNIIRVRQDTNEQVIYAPLGYLLTGANS